MRTWMTIFLAAANLTAAEPPPLKPAATPPPAAEVAPPGPEDAIPPAVKALAPPGTVRFPGGIDMAVSAANAEAQRAVLQGLNHLHGGWEFEASRHFAVALRHDPDCLLAHWGMVMALLVPTPETGKARNAAAERMLGLLEQGQGTELERGYVYGLIKYLDEGPVSAAVAFRKVARKFPNDLQAAVFGALFGRTGYYETGEPTPDQERAEQELLALIKARPDSPLPLNALLSIRAEGQNLAPSVELARKLCLMAPDYPPYHHLLGHYEWRTGNHQAAALAFGRAVMLYDNWMKTSNAPVADCPEWVKAEAYRVVALASKGEFDTAMAAAKQLAARPMEVNRALSAGTRLQLWEAQTLPARLLMRRGKPGDAALALAALPKPESLKVYHGKCMAFWWIDALRIALEAQRLTDEGKLTEARQAAEALAFHGDKMAQAQPAANQNGERSAWTRAFRAMELLACDLRGRIALRGPKALQGTAYNWFRSGADRQRPATMLYPPVVLSSALVKLGYFHLLDEQPEAAIEAFNEALKSFPNDIDGLQGLQRAYEAANKPAEAAAVAAQIKRQTAP
jgi:tetratricopeptide (TPR) repeat protein